MLGSESQINQNTIRPQNCRSGKHRERQNPTLYQLRLPDLPIAHAPHHQLFHGTEGQILPNIALLSHVVNTTASQALNNSVWHAIKVQ